MKKNENDGGGSSGFASLADTPGMGDVTMPTATTTGSGDVFGTVLGFGLWKRSNRRKRKRSKRR